MTMPEETFNISLAKEIVLDKSQGKHTHSKIPDKYNRLIYVGTSMWGHVYKAKAGLFAYRILPIEEIYQAEQRAEIRQIMKKPRQPGIAPIVEADQTLIENKSYYYICYEVETDQPWIDMLADPDPVVRLQSGLLVLRELPNWYERLDEGLLPMPPDIFFAQDSPFLLHIPFLGFPGVPALLSSPTRILHLAPEVIRGQQLQVWDRNVALYSIMIAILLSAFSTDLNKPVEWLLTRVANGTLYIREKMKERLPLWLNKLETIQGMYRTLFQTVHPDIRERTSISIETAAEAIERGIPLLNPKTAVQDIMRKRKPQDALNLLQDILFDTPTYTLLLLAGMIAKENLNNQLEAVGFFERAIKLDIAEKTGQSEAYMEQLKLLLKPEILALLTLTGGNEFTVSDKLDDVVWRDFSQLTPEQQKELAIETAKYYILRRQYDKAAHLIHPHLYDEENVYLWWEFPKTLVYLETLIGMKRLPDAAQLLHHIKQCLAKVQAAGHIRRETCHQYGQEVTRLELMLHERWRESIASQKGN
jgi:hypothetical protein